MSIDYNLFDKVDLGCGTVYTKNFLRVDKNVDVNPDICVDLEKPDWPLLSNHFIEIKCVHVVEHLHEINVFLNEVVRISKCGCRFVVEFPHFSNNFIEPDHRRAYGLHALVSRPEIKVDKMRLEWSPNRKNKSKLYYFMDWFITSVANYNPYVCERVWCYWVGGFSNVVLSGKIIK